MSAHEATRVCVLTPSGRGAVAVVAVEGEAAVSSVGRYFQAANGRPLCEQTIGRIVYGHWGDSDGEDLVVCRRCDDRLEIHCHGGWQSSAQIIADLSVAGCTSIDAEEWLSHEHNCPLAASAHLAMAQATTFHTAAILLAQYHGALRREIESIHAELGGGNTVQASERLKNLLQFTDLGQHLTNPWRVVIAGEPNVGKSSLINALVGYERAIVFDQPGTTRDIVTSTTAIAGWPVELSDTAGLHETSPTNEIGAIENAGIALARERLLTADLVIWVLDASAITVAVWEEAKKQARAVGVKLAIERTLMVINKIDLVDVAVDESQFSVGTSAVTGAGVEQLLAAIATRLVSFVPSPQAAVPFTTEQVEVLQAALKAADSDDVVAASASLRELLARSS